MNENEKFSFSNQNRKKGSFMNNYSYCINQEKANITIKSVTNFLIIDEHKTSKVHEKV